LALIAPIKVSLCEVELHKHQPDLAIRTSLAKENYTDKGLVLVDDVLNSGTTLIYAVRHFLEVPLKNSKQQYSLTEITKIPCKS